MGEINMVRSRRDAGAAGDLHRHRAAADPRGQLDLRASSTVNEQKEKIEFFIDAAGTRYWNSEVVTREEAARLPREKTSPMSKPEIHLKADQTVAYK